MGFMSIKQLMTIENTILCILINLNSGVCRIWEGGPALQVKSGIPATQ